MLIYTAWHEAWRLCWNSSNFFGSLPTFAGWTGCRSSLKQAKLATSCKLLSIFHAQPLQPGKSKSIYCNSSGEPLLFWTQPNSRSQGSKSLVPSLQRLMPNRFAIEMRCLHWQRLVVQSKLEGPSERRLSNLCFFSFHENIVSFQDKFRVQVWMDAGQSEKSPIGPITKQRLNTRHTLQPECSKLR